MMKKMEPVVLQITDLLRYVFRNPSRILAYMNSYFTKHMDAMQYCEEIENGFLFIFRDFEAFKFRSQPLKPMLLEEANPEENDLNLFFRSFFIPKKHFPTTGIDIEVKVIEGEATKVLPLSIDFVRSVHKDIEIRDVDTQHFIFHIAQYDVIQIYVNSLFRRFSEKKKL